eukprot:SAG31_NODE_21157_length_556_cov_1.242888_1_plen_111_part_10
MFSFHHRQGYPFHNHYAAWETVVVGRKLLMTFPPELRSLAVQDIEALTLIPPHRLILNLSRWLDQHNISVCTLKPGDTVFIPCNHYHATLNIGDTVAVGSMKTDISDGSDS